MYALLTGFAATYLFLNFAKMRDPALGGWIAPGAPAGSTPSTADPHSTRPPLT